MPSSVVSCRCGGRRLPGGSTPLRISFSIELDTSTYVERFACAGALLAPRAVSLPETIRTDVSIQNRLCPRLCGILPILYQTSAAAMPKRGAPERLASGRPRLQGLRHRPSRENARATQCEF